MIATVMGRWHLRHLTIDKRNYSLTIAGVGDKKHKQTLVMQKEAIMIRDISLVTQQTKCKWPHFFTLETRHREFKFFAPTLEERDLWIESLHLYMNIPVRVTLAPGFNIPSLMNAKNVFKVSLSFAKAHPTLHE